METSCFPHINSKNPLSCIGVKLPDVRHEFKFMISSSWNVDVINLGYAENYVLQPAIKTELSTVTPRMPLNGSGRGPTIVHWPLLNISVLEK